MLDNKSAITSVTLSKEGGFAVTAGMDKVVRFWDVGSGKIMREFKGHDEVISSVALNLNIN